MIISYAQNFEDVMLWRALKHIDNGFYVDVGACDPDELSVTRAFYDANWSGINIEPVPENVARLKARRPRDITLAVGAGEVSSEVPFYVIADTGLSTANERIAHDHQEHNWNVESTELKIVPLADICETYVTTDIHFLKVDVEGMEAAVIKGMDFKRWRPWILVIEATAPMSQTDTYSEWEPLLLAQKYDFVYFDGLNRFYVAAERAELKSAFSSPPNVFDDFITARTLDAERRVAQFELTTAELENKLQEKHKEITSLNGRYSSLDTSLIAERQARIVQEERAIGLEEALRLHEEKMDALLQSSIWRLSKPLRSFKDQLTGRNSRIRSEDINTPSKMNPKRIAVSMARSAVRSRPVMAMIGNAKFRHQIAAVLYKYPRLDAKMRRFFHSSLRGGTSHVASSQIYNDTPISEADLKALPDSVRRILTVLEQTKRH